MHQISKVKIILAAGFTAITAWLGTLAVPLYLLVVLMIVDYLTALRAAKFRGQKLDSEKGIKGIEKKVFMLVLILVGGITDIFIYFLIHTLGFNFSLFTPIAISITLWLVINEIISVLENIKDILGDKVPDWLGKFLNIVKSKIEQSEPGDDSMEKEDNQD